MSARVSKLANVIVPVADQDRALKFYTDALGLETRADVPFGDGNRWIEVAPPGAETTQSADAGQGGAKCPFR